jgi:hypothetical protein
VAAEHHLGALVLMLRTLAESADQPLNDLRCGFALIALVTGAQDCHDGVFETGSNVLLKQIEEGDEDKAIFVAGEGSCGYIEIWFYEQIAGH